MNCLKELQVLIKYYGQKAMVKEVIRILQEERALDHIERVKA